MRAFVPTILCLLFLSFPGLATATEAPWVTAKATAQVAYTVDKTTWIPLQKGMHVPNNAWISTGPRGRVQLVRGSESIGFQPNTLAAIITRGGGNNRQTEVVQQLGEISLEIEKRQRPHTTVQTPFMAAVVKGTRFTVQVGKRDAAVAVEQGLVQVTSFGSGERSNVGAGQGTRVDASGMTVAGIAGKPQITRVAPARARVPAAGTTAPPPSTPEDPTVGTKKDKAIGSARAKDDKKEGKAGGKNNVGDNGKNGGNGDSGGKGKSDGGGKGDGGGNGNGGGKGDSGGNGKGGDKGDGGGKGGGGGNGDSGGSGKGGDKGNGGGSGKGGGKGKDR